MPQGQDRVKEGRQLVWVSILEKEYQQEKQIRAVPSTPVLWMLVVWTLGRKLMSNYALCWPLFETICCLFSSKVWNVRDNYFSYLAWPLPSWEHTSLCTGSILTQCSVERKLSRQLEKSLGIRHALQQTVWISATCPVPLWRCCEVRDVSHALGGSEIATLGQTPPWDGSYPIGHLSYLSAASLLPSGSFS